MTTSAEADGDTVTVTLDEDLASVNSKTLHFYWQVTGPTLAQHPSQVTVSGRTVTMKLGTPITAGQAITVSYEPSNHLKDLTGNTVGYFNVTATNLTE